MLRIALVFIVCEKVIQHAAVTLALWFDVGNIRATVVPDPRVLMMLGAIIAVLFLIALWGVLRNDVWTAGLLIGLALFDIVGEFVGQGKFAIVLNVSFLVAVTLLILAIAYRRQLRGS